METRKQKSLRNIIIAFLSNILVTILSFFTSRIIKDHLGLEVLGLNGVFSNIISILSLSEMGIGTAITFALYEPLSSNNRDLIKSIMQFYKKAYRIVAVVVAGFGLILLPFIRYFVKTKNYSISYINEVYLLFLFNSVISYLLVYKRTLIVADQKNYVITLLTLIYTFALKIIQLLVVYYTSNYLLFLTVNIICTLIYNISIDITCNKLYPYLLDKNIVPLPIEIHEVIKSKIKALFLHSIGTVAVYGTDNLLISLFCGVEDAGRYTSYLNIISIITTIISLLYDNIKDSIGNFMVSEDKSRQKELLYRLFFMNQSLVSICSICLILLLTPFLKLWLGNDIILSKSVVLAMVVSFYFSKNNLTIGTIKNSKGLFEQDKFAPLIESIINLVSSIIFAKLFGLLGIIMGTILSTILVPFWVQPYVVEKYVFNENCMHYFITYSTYFLRTTIIYFILNYLCNHVIKFVPANFIEFFIESAVIFIVTSILWFSTLFNKIEFKYFRNLLINKVLRRKQ